MSGAPIFAKVKYHTKNHCFLTLPRSWIIQPSGQNVKTFSIERAETSDKLYASWNGEYSEDNRVGVNRQLAASLGLEENAAAVFTLVPNIVKCFQVTLKPASAEDWEVMQMNIPKIQNGLLDQLRVFWKDLMFPFYVHSGFSINIHVVSTEPAFAPIELSQTTEVHIVPLVLPSRKPVLASQTPTDLQGSTSITTKPVPTKNVDPPPNCIEARLIDSINGPQTEVILRTNSMTDDFFGFMRRKSMVSDAVKRKTVPEAKGLLPDGCYPLKGETICRFRVEINPEKDCNEILCSWPLRYRLGLEDCCVVLIQRFEEPIEDVKTVILNPITNPQACPTSEAILKTMLDEMLRREGPLIATAGTYLRFKDFGVIVNVEKTGLLKEETNLSVILGRTLARHNLENTFVAVPVESCLELSMLHENDDIKSMQGVSVLNAKESKRSILEQRVLRKKMNLVHEIKNSCEKSGQVILVTAAEGVGKTFTIELILNHLLRNYSIFWKKVACSSQRGKRTENLAKDWRKVFEEAEVRAPSVIFFDDLDSLCGVPSGQEGNNAIDTQYLARNCRVFIDFAQKIKQKKRMCIIATAKSWSGLSTILTKTPGLHLFDEVVDFKAPDADERSSIFQVHAEDLGLKCADFEEIGRRTDGFVSRDIYNLAQKLSIKLVRDNSTEITSEILEATIKTITPTALRGLNLKDKSDSPPDWDSVGGMNDQKKLLQETFLWPTLYPKLMQQCPIRLVSGVLLYGMPGTGKTRLASCLAQENKLNFISVKGPELLSKFVGASELAVRDLFHKAKTAAPCVIFFDEFDSMAPRRGHDSTGVTDRCVNQLLTLLDGVETDGGVAILAATSRPELIDPALLRPGRLDRCLECPLPQTADERKIILEALSKNVSFENCDFDEIAEQTENFSGADLQALLFNAQLAAIQDTVKDVCGGDVPEKTSSLKENLNFEGIRYTDIGGRASQQMTQNSYEALPESFQNELKMFLRPKKQLKENRESQTKLTQKHLLMALKETRPSLSDSEIRKYRTAYDTFRNGGVDLKAELKGRVTMA